MISYCIIIIIIIIIMSSSEVTPAWSQQCAGRNRRQRRTERVRYNGACGYYICYSIFVSIVGLMLLLLLLTLHLARCVIFVSDKSTYDCFISLTLGRASTHWDRLQTVPMFVLGFKLLTVYRLNWPIMTLGEQRAAHPIYWDYLA